MLAGVENNIFFKNWFDELYLAIRRKHQKSIFKKLKIQRKIRKIFFKRIGNLEYLVAYVACQKVLRKSFPSITLIDCDENAFYYQVKNR